MRPVQDFVIDSDNWTIEQTAKKLQRSVRTVHRLLAAGMPSRIDGKRLAISGHQARAWLIQRGLLRP